MPSEHVSVTRWLGRALQIVLAVWVTDWIMGDDDNDLQNIEISNNIH